MAGALKRASEVPAVCWIAGSGDDGEIHVVPRGDTYPHRTDGHCWCGADWDEECDEIIHNSHDGREAYENGGRKQH